MYLRHVLAWILIVPFMSSLVLLVTAHSGAAIRHITEFYAEFRSHGNYTGLAPIQPHWPFGACHGTSGKTAWKPSFAYLPYLLASAKVLRSSESRLEQRFPAGIPCGLYSRWIDDIRRLMRAIVVTSSGKHRTDTDRGLSVSELGRLANQAANVPPYVPGTSLNNKLMPDGFQDIAIGDSRDDVLRRHPGTNSSPTAVVPLDGKGFTRVTLAFAGDGNGTLEMVVFNRFVPFSEAHAIVQATIDEDVTRYHRLPESIDERLRLRRAGSRTWVPSSF